MHFWEEKGLNLTFHMFRHTSSEEVNLWTTTEIQIYGMELKVKLNLFWLNT